MLLSKYLNSGYYFLPINVCNVETFFWVESLIIGGRVSGSYYRNLLKKYFVEGHCRRYSDVLRSSSKITPVGTGR